MTRIAPLPPPAACAKWLRRHAIAIAIVAYGLGLVAAAATLDVSEDVRGLVANLAYLPLATVGGLLCWRIARTPGQPRRQRQAWGVMVAACVLTSAGDIWWTIEENLRGVDPSESLANLPYLAYYVVLLGGLLLMPAALRSSRDALKFGLDAATIVTGGTMAVWHFVIGPTLRDSDISTFGLAIAVCYPLGDLLLLLGISGVLLRCPRGPRQRPLLLLTASISAMFVGDLVWAHLSLVGEVDSGNLQDVGFLTQYVLFGVAAADEHRRLGEHTGEPVDAGSRRMSALPYIAVIAGYGLLLAVASSNAGPELYPLVLGAVALTVLVLLRQVIALRDNIRLHREHALAASDTRFKKLIQHASDIVTIIDADWRIAFVSPSAASTLGYEAAELVGTSIFDLMDTAGARDAMVRLRELLAEPQRTMSAQWRLRRKDGTWLRAETIGTNLMAEEEVRGLVLTSRDVSERVLLEEQLIHQAFHDPLTGLANRALFNDRVRQSLTRRHANDALAVLFIDLDGFKTVNDSLGHSVGDQLLQHASRRLAKCLRATATAARLGGDEFAVLLDDAGARGDVVDIAARIAAVFKSPFAVGGREVVVTASVGIAFADPMQSAEDLLRNADLAMYLAKSRGRAQTALYDPDMHLAVLTRLEMQADLHGAQDRGELSLAYQPIHSLETHRLVGVEALLRWQHPTRGTIPPSAFIPLAEETGAIVSIGRWVIQRACSDVRHWRDTMPGNPFRVSVNLSSRQIGEPDLVSDVEHALLRSQLPANSLVLELTESVLLEHTDKALSSLSRLKEIGVGLALDDFGTGYSSLSYLQRLPIDILKIDRAFVERIETDSNAAGLTRAIVALGTTLSLGTVAEGVESASQAFRLRELGCDFGQGYLYSHALPSTDLERYARRCHSVKVA